MILSNHSQGELIEERGGEDGLRGLAVDSTPDHLTEGLRAHPTSIDHAEQVAIRALLPMGMEYQENDGFGAS